MVVEVVGCMTNVKSDSIDGGGGSKNEINE